MSQFGIQIRGRSRRLRLNYRTTAQNLAYAVGILEGEQWEALEEGQAADALEVKGNVSVRSGPRPDVLLAETESEEMTTAAEQIASWVQGEIP